MKRFFEILIVTVAILSLSGCAGLTYRDIGAVAGAAVGAEASKNRPIAGAVAGGVAGAVIGSMVDRHAGPSGTSSARQVPEWADPSTNCTTNSNRDYRTGKTTESTRCSASFRRPHPGGYESCYGNFESRRIDGGPNEVLRDEEKCTTVLTHRGYRTW
jgi:hypothetical protein